MRTGAGPLGEGITGGRGCFVNAFQRLRTQTGLTAAGWVSLLKTWSLRNVDTEISVAREGRTVGGGGEPAAVTEPTTIVSRTLGPSPNPVLGQCS